MCYYFDDIININDINIILLDKKSYENILNCDVAYKTLWVSKPLYTIFDKEIKINSDYDVPFEKTINMHNIVMLIKSVFNENDYHYYYYVFF